MRYKLLTTLLFLIFLSWSTACRSRWSKTSPILQLRPTSPDDSSLIWYNSGYKKKSLHFINDLNNFLKPYLNTNNSVNAEECRQMQPPSKGKFCSFKLHRHYIPCLPEYEYGFNLHGGPCIVLQLTQFPKNWIPQFYNSTNLPKDMPEYLKSAILFSEQRSMHQYVWVTCDGENPADQENIGPVMFMPSRGFPVNYLLNTQVEGYRSPLVVVRFEHPTRGVLINIKCTAWANNIPRDPELKIGTVHFELMVD